MSDRSEGDSVTGEERTEAAAPALDWEPEYGFCGLNERPNTDLAAALEVIRRRICAYGGATRCDCKYGLHPDEDQRAGPEQTGCPELREVINRLLHRPGTFAPQEVTW